MFYILALILLVIGGFVSGFLLGTIHGIHKEQDNHNFFSINGKEKYPEDNPEAHKYNQIQTDVVEDTIKEFKENFQREGIK